jgi:hypothetical protein
MYYRVVFKETANTSEVNVGEVALYGASSGILNRFVKPVLLKDCVLHPWRIFEMEDTSFNVFRVTDLSCNWIRDGLHNGYTCDPVFPGSETSGTAFNGKYHVTFMKTGEAVYLSNTESLQGLQYDSVLNGLTLATGLTDIRTACFNRKFVLIGGAGGAAYGILSSNSPPEFHNSNLSSLMSTVNCIASNSGYGHVVCKNTIELKENERLSVTTPKYSVSQTSISFNVYKQE